MSDHVSLFQQLHALTAVNSTSGFEPDICIGIDATISQAGSGTGVAPMPATAFSEAANALRKGPGLSVSDHSFRTGGSLLASGY